MRRIHPSAVVDPAAELGDEVEVGPFCVIGPHVRIGDGTRLIAHVVVDGYTTLGRGCTIYPFAAVGTRTQDLKYRGGAPRAEIGDGTTIREYVTVSSATADGDVTRVGARCLLMACCHVAHDCVLGDDVIIANCAGLSGHVVVEDQAVIGGLAGIHQFVRIGTVAMIGGLAKITQDVPPYMLADGHPATVPTINRVGLERRGFSPATIEQLKRAHRLIYREGLNVHQALERIRAELSGPEIARLVEFIEQSKRGILR